MRFIFLITSLLLAVSARAEIFEWRINASLTYYETSGEGVSTNKLTQQDIVRRLAEYYGKSEFEKASLVFRYDSDYDRFGYYLALRTGETLDVDDHFYLGEYSYVGGDRAGVSNLYVEMYLNGFDCWFSALETYQLRARNGYLLPAAWQINGQGSVSINGRVEVPCSLSMKFAGPRPVKVRTSNASSGSSYGYSQIGFGTTTGAINLGSVPVNGVSGNTTLYGTTSTVNVVDSVIVGSGVSVTGILTTDVLTINNGYFDLNANNPSGSLNVVGDSIYDVTGSIGTSLITFEPVVGGGE